MWKIGHSEGILSIILLLVAWNIKSANQNHFRRQIQFKAYPTETTHLPTKSTQNGSVGLGKVRNVRNLPLNWKKIGGYPVIADLWRPAHWPEVDHATASPSGWSLGIARWLHTWWEVTYFQIVMVWLIHWIGLDWQKVSDRLATVCK